MTIPFNDPTNVFYDTYSIAASSFSIPAHFDVFAPDNEADFRCVSVICPNISVGASKWTHEGRWLTIGIYRDEGRVGYSETHYVFRLLPSFKLVPYSIIQQLFQETAPRTSNGSSYLYNVTTDAQVKLPQGKSRSINYEIPITRSDRVRLDVRFDQAYDETGAPLALVYHPTGDVIELNRVDSINKNSQEFFLTPQTNELTPGDDATTDSVVDVYDFYGLKVNDSVRVPYNATNIIIRDLDATPPRNNIARRLQGTVEIQPGTLYDRYGNIVLGIQENNALFVRLPILPLQLDTFGCPIKTPLKKASTS